MLALRKGSHCYQPEQGCKQEGLTLPIGEYYHSQGCSVTGGYLYRGKKYPKLVGHYLFADFCSGNFWSLSNTGTDLWKKTFIGKVDIMPSSFGEDEQGELYVLDHRGPVYHIGFVNKKPPF